MTGVFVASTERRIVKVFIDEAGRYHDDGELEMAMEFYRRAEEYVQRIAQHRARYCVRETLTNYRHVVSKHRSK